MAEKKTKDETRREKFAAIQDSVDRWVEREEMERNGEYDDELPSQIHELQNVLRIAHNLLDEKSDLVKCLFWYASANEMQLRDDGGDRALETLRETEKMNN